MSRLVDWIARDNARSDAILAARSTGWLLARTLLGVLLAAKGISLMLHGTSTAEYLIGPLAVIAGVAFAFESAMTIRERGRGKAPNVPGQN